MAVMEAVTIPLNGMLLGFAGCAGAGESVPVLSPSISTCDARVCRNDLLSSRTGEGDIYELL